MKFKDALDSVIREIAIMKKLIHPNVIKLYEVIENPDNDKLYMSKNISIPFKIFNLCTFVLHLMIST